jgi:hypothetical protein
VSSRASRSRGRPLALTVRRAFRLLLHRAGVDAGDPLQRRQLDPPPSLNSIPLHATHRYTPQQYQQHTSSSSGSAPTSTPEPAAAQHKMQRILAADLGGFHKAHELSGYALGSESMPCDRSIPMHAPCRVSLRANALSLSISLPPLLSSPRAQSSLPWRPSLARCVARSTRCSSFSPNPVPDRPLRPACASASTASAPQPRHRSDRPSPTDDPPSPPPPDPNRHDRAAASRSSPTGSWPPPSLSTCTSAPTRASRTTCRRASAVSGARGGGSGAIDQRLVAPALARPPVGERRPDEGDTAAHPPLTTPNFHHPTQTPTAPVRAAVLATSVVAYLGIMKVNLTGPGLTETVKTLWRKPAKAQAAKAE